MRAVAVPSPRRLVAPAVVTAGSAWAGTVSTGAEYDDARRTATRDAGTPRSSATRPAPASH